MVFFSHWFSYSELQCFFLLITSWSQMTTVCILYFTIFRSRGWGFSLSLHTQTHTHTPHHPALKWVLSFLATLLWSHLQACWTSPTRDGTHAPLCWKYIILTTGWPGKSNHHEPDTLRNYCALSLKKKNLENSLGTVKANQSELCL